MPSIRRSYLFVGRRCQENPTILYRKLTIHQKRPTTHQKGPTDSSMLLFRGVVGTTVELEFVTEKGSAKVVTLRRGCRVAAGAPASPPSPLTPQQQLPWQTPDSKSMCVPSLADMKTPRERLLFQSMQISSTSPPASRYSTPTPTVLPPPPSSYSQSSMIRAEVWAGEGRATRHVTSLEEWHTDRIYSRADVAQLLFSVCLYLSLSLSLYLSVLALGVSLCLFAEWLCACFR